MESDDSTSRCSLRSCKHIPMHSSSSPPTSSLDDDAFAMRFASFMPAHEAHSGSPPAHVRLAVRVPEGATVHTTTHMMPMSDEQERQFAAALSGQADDAMGPAPSVSVAPLPASAASDSSQPSTAASAAAAAALDAELAAALARLEASEAQFAEARAMHEQQRRAQHSGGEAAQRGQTSALAAVVESSLGSPSRRRDEVPVRTSGTSPVIPATSPQRAHTTRFRVAAADYSHEQEQKYVSATTAPVSRGVAPTSSSRAFLRHLDNVPSFVRRQEPTTSPRLFGVAKEPSVSPRLFSPRLVGAAQETSDSHVSLSAVLPRFEAIQPKRTPSPPPASSIPAGFELLGPSPSSEVADLFRQSRQRREAPRSRALDPEQGLVQGSGLRSIGRTDALRLAASLASIEALPSLAQMLVPGAATAELQPSPPASSPPAAPPSHRSSPAAAPLSVRPTVSHALSLSLGKPTTPSTQDLERQYEDMRRAYEVELREKARAEEEARMKAQQEHEMRMEESRQRMRQEEEWRERQRQQHQQSVQQAQWPQQQHSRSSSTMPAHPAAAPANTGADLIPSHQSAPHRSSSPSFSSHTSQSQASAREQSRPSQQPAPPLTFSAHSAAALDRLTNLLAGQLEQLHRATHEQPPTPVTHFVRAQLDHIEQRVRADSFRRGSLGQQEQVLQEVRGLGALLASSATSSARSAEPADPERSPSHSRATSTHMHGSERPVSSRAASSHGGLPESQHEPSLLSSARDQNPDEEYEYRIQQYRAAQQRRLQQSHALSAQAAAPPPKRTSAQPRITHHPKKPSLQPVSEASSSHASVSSVSTPGSTPPSVQQPSSHSRAPSLLSDSQLVHSSHNRKYSSAQVSMQGESELLQLQPEPSHQQASQQQPVQHGEATPANSHKDASKQRPSKATKKGGSAARVSATHLPLTTREVRALVRSEVLGSPAELCSTYTYLPPPPRPIPLTRTQMLQQAARDASTRAACAPARVSYDAQLSKRAAPVAAAVRHNVERMLEEQVRRRAPTWAAEAKEHEDDDHPIKHEAARSDEHGSKQVEETKEMHQREHHSILSSPARLQHLHRELDDLLRQPSRLLQPSFSPPKHNMHPSSHSPARPDQPHSQQAQLSDEAPSRIVSSRAPESGSGSGALHSRVASDDDIHSHLQQLFSNARLQLNPIAPSSSCSGLSSVRSSRRGSQSDTLSSSVHLDEDTSSAAHTPRSYAHSDTPVARASGQSRVESGELPMRSTSSFLSSGPSQTEEQHGRSSGMPQQRMAGLSPTTGAEDSALIPPLTAAPLVFAPPPPARSTSRSSATSHGHLMTSQARM